MKVNCCIFRSHARQREREIRVSISRSKTNFFDDIIKRARCVRNRRIKRENKNRSSSNNSNCNDHNNNIIDINNNINNATSNQVTFIRLRELKTICLRFCLTLLTCRCRDNKYKLFMLCVMIVLTIKFQN